jgi:hypothetical protein
MNLKTFFALILLSLFELCIINAYELIYALNAGGDVHVDSDGIKYDKDTNNDPITVAGNWLPSLKIGRVPESDRILYESVRYSEKYIKYTLPVRKDGHYILNLKFGDTYVKAVGERLFNLKLNSEHFILFHMDIMKKGGLLGTCDEFIHFEVCDNGRRLFYKNAFSEIKDHKIPLEFVVVKAYSMLGAMVLLKGSVGESVSFVSSTSKETIYFGEKSHCGSDVAVKQPWSPYQLFQHSNISHFTIINNYYYNGSRLNKVESQVLDDNEL